jgi:hypothetical protein
MEIKLALTEILTKYEIEPCNKTEIPITFSMDAVATEADPESRNCGSSHFKRPFIRDETELEMNTL